MVFVYGGRFMYGDALPGRYGPHYFMDKDIIVITFHYRQGPFGTDSSVQKFTGTRNGVSRQEGVYILLTRRWWFRGEEAW